jgi:hypothetical protein
MSAAAEFVKEVGRIPESILSRFGFANYGLLTVLIVLVLIAWLATKPTGSMNQRSAHEDKPIVPVVQPKAVTSHKPVLPAKVVPKITKLEAIPKVDKVDTPVMNPKSVTPVMNPKSVLPALVEPKDDVENTFEAYRKAMLSSGPRQMEEEARTELQSKTGSAAWREQTASLRSTLRDESAASFLERTNTSINDRMVAIFDAVKVSA